MDPISLSLAIAPLVTSSGKLVAAVGSIRHLYKHAETAVTSTHVECDLMHVALCEVQGLVPKNRTELAVHLRSQQSLQETFNKVLTGCRITLDALKLELDDLLKLPKCKLSRSEDMDFQSKAQYIWKKRGIAADNGLVYGGRDDGLTDRHCQRSKTRSRSPPRMIQGFRDNYNPYRDERRDDLRRPNHMSYG